MTGVQTCALRSMFTIRPDFLFTAPVTINPATMNTDQLSIKVKELQDQIDEIKNLNAAPENGTQEPVPPTSPTTPESK